MARNFTDSFFLNVSLSDLTKYIYFNIIISINNNDAKNTIFLIIELFTILNVCRK